MAPAMACHPLAGLRDQIMARYELRESRPGDEIWLAGQSPNFPQIWATANILDHCGWTFSKVGNVDQHLQGVHGEVHSSQPPTSKE